MSVSLPPTSLPATSLPATGAAPDDATVEVVQQLGALHRRVEHLQTVLAGGLGIGVTDLRALVLIGGATQVTPKRVADELGLTTGSITPVLDRLERIGLLRRTPNPHDRRSTLLALTDVGSRSRSWAVEHYRTAVAAAVLPPEALDVRLAADVLGRLVRALLAVEVRTV